MSLYTHSRFFKGTISKVKCTDLPASDSNGFSDPFVKFKIEGVTVVTPKKMKTLDPVWDDFAEDFIAEVPLPLADRRIKISVWDYDFLSSPEFLGSYSFPLLDALTGPTHYKLELKDGAMQHAGTLEFDLRIGDCTTAIASLSDITLSNVSTQSFLKKKLSLEEASHFLRLGFVPSKKLGSLKPAIKNHTEKMEVALAFKHYSFFQLLREGIIIQLFHNAKGYDKLVASAELNFVDFLRSANPEKQHFSTQLLSTNKEIVAFIEGDIEFAELPIYHQLEDGVYIDQDNVTGKRRIPGFPVIASWIDIPTRPRARRVVGTPVTGAPAAATTTSSALSVPSTSQESTSPKSPKKSPLEMPEAFICPISKRIMLEPIVLADEASDEGGIKEIKTEEDNQFTNSFDKLSLDKWFENSANASTHPVSHKKITPLFIPNTYLKQEIRTWLKSHPKFLDEAFLLACERNNKQVIHELLELGANINATGELGRNCLYYAIEVDDLSAVEYFADRNADLTHQYHYTKTIKVSPLLHAGILVGKMATLPIIKYLLEKKNLNVFAQSSSGRDLLDYAIMFNHLEAVQYLVSKFNINVTTSERDDTTYLFTALANSTSIALITYLAGASKQPIQQNLEFVTSRKKTAIHAAALNSRTTDTIKYCLENGLRSQINAQDADSFTPLHLAARLCNASSVEYLINENADINQQDKRQQTALHIALQANIDTNKILKTVQVLLDYGVDSSIQNNEGKTVLDLAQARKLSEVVRMIQEIEKTRASASKRVPSLIREVRELQKENKSLREQVQSLQQQVSRLTVSNDEEFSKLVRDKLHQHEEMISRLLSRMAEHGTAEHL